MAIKFKPVLIPGSKQKLYYHFTHRTPVKLPEGLLIMNSDMTHTLPAPSQALEPQNVPLYESPRFLVIHFYPDHDGRAQDLNHLGASLIVLERQQPFIHISEPILGQDRRLRFIPLHSQEKLLRGRPHPDKAASCGLV